MKTFALALLATSVLGKVFPGRATQTVDLTNDHADENGYSVAPGEALEFILEANPSTGYGWDYDETIIDGLFKVKSIYKQDKGCGKGMMGCGGAQHFKIIAGQHEGEGTFFTCNTRGSEEVRYDVMANLLGNDCEEITIRVEDDSVESYDLTNQDDIDFLTVAMSDLMVGETFKVSIEQNASVGYHYEVVQDGDHLDVEENEKENFIGKMKLGGRRLQRPRRSLVGGPTTVEYTIEVMEAGEGNITFEPK